MMYHYIVLLLLTSNVYAHKTLRYNRLNIIKEDKYLNSSQLLRNYGYPAEDHTVVTEDGYKLSLVRIPRPGRPVVFVMHGLISSSDDYITSGIHKALAYTLSNASYEIWLGNARGNKYSKKHTSLSPKERKFWEFSWHEIGYYDLPAMIDYALQKSGQSTLSYIGHSQGTTAFLVLCSERPEYNDKIKVFVSLATVAYTWHILQPLLNSLAPFNVIQYLLFYNSGIYELFAFEDFQFLTGELCNLSRNTQFFCMTAFFTVSGFDYAQIDYENLAVQLSHFPGGGAIKQLIHYFQNKITNKFAKYDFGRDNFKVYGQLGPPSYEVEKVTVPIAIFHGNNDLLSTSKDLSLLIQRLPNVVLLYKVPFEQFGHFDFLWAKDAKELVYVKVLEVLGKYSGVN